LLQHIMLDVLPLFANQLDMRHIALVILKSLLRNYAQHTESPEMFHLFL
jgi:hypothetical protein